MTKEEYHKRPDPLIRILKDFEKHKGEMVITDTFKVMKLIAIGGDGWDYYYVCWDGRKTHWFTCVGAYIVLKGKIDKKSYNWFVHIAKLNWWDSDNLWNTNTKVKQTTELLEYAKKTRAKFSKLKGKNDKYLTEVCWEYN